MKYALSQDAYQNKNIIGKPETWTEMNGKVLVTFFKPFVLAHIMQVIPTNDDCPLHLHLKDNASQDSTTNADIASKRAFLVNVRPFKCLYTITCK